MGFTNSKANTFMFFFKSGVTLMFLLIYVDAKLVTGNDIIIIKWFISELINRLFALKDIDDLNFFLDIEVHWDKTSVYLNQGKHISHLFNKLKLQHIKTMFNSCNIWKSSLSNEGDCLENPTEYRSLIGAWKISHKYKTWNFLQSIFATSNHHPLAGSKKGCYDTWKVPSIMPY